MFSIVSSVTTFVQPFGPLCGNQVQYKIDWTVNVSDLSFQKFSTCQLIGLLLSLVDFTANV